LADGTSISALEVASAGQSCQQRFRAI